MENNEENNVFQGKELEENKGVNSLERKNLNSKPDQIKFRLKGGRGEAENQS